jgi:uncharacterized protein (DUF305 family)
MSDKAQPASTRNLALVVAALLAALVAIIALASCGGEDSADAEDTDGAFIVEMIPHHEAAIEMAEIAAEEAEHPQVRKLAGQIVSTQAGR